MSAVLIRPEQATNTDALFRAVSGEHQTTGRTMGESADFGAVVRIQKQQADTFFTDSQFERMQDVTIRSRIAA